MPNHRVRLNYLPAQWAKAANFPVTVGPCAGTMTFRVQRVIVMELGQEILLPIEGTYLDGYSLPVDLEYKTDFKNLVYSFKEKYIYLKCKANRLYLQPGDSWNFNLLQIDKHVIDWAEIKNFEVRLLEIDDWKNSNYPERRDLERDLHNRISLTNNYSFPYDKFWFDDAFINTNIKKIDTNESDSRWVIALVLNGKLFDRVEEFYKGSRIKFHNDVPELVFKKDNPIMVIDLADKCGGFNNRTFNFFNPFDTFYKSEPHWVILKPTGASKTGVELAYRYLAGSSDFFINNIIFFDVLPMYLINNVYCGKDRPWRSEWTNYLQSDPCILLDVRSWQKDKNLSCALITILKTQIRKNGKHIWTRNEIHAPETSGEMNDMIRIINSFCDKYSSDDHTSELSKKIKEFEISFIKEEDSKRRHDVDEEVAISKKRLRK